MTKVKVGLGCLLELLKKDPIVKIVSELPPKETAELNFIYIVPKDNAGQDKRAYVLRPDRSGYDAIDLSPQVIDVIGEGFITVKKEVHNENGDITFTVTTSPSFQAVLDSLTAKDKELDTKVSALEAKDAVHEANLSAIEAKDSEQDTKLAGHDKDIADLKAHDDQVEDALEALGKNIEKTVDLVDAKALELKKDNERQDGALDDLGESVKDLNESVQHLDEEHGKAIADLQKDSQDMKELTSELDNSINEINDQLKLLDGGLEDEVKAVHTEVNDITDAVTELENRTDKLAEDIENKAQAQAEKDGSQDAEIKALQDKDSEVEDALGTLGTTLGKAVDLIDNKSQWLDTRVKALEAKEDSDKQTLAIAGNKLSISNGNEVDLPQYDDTSVKDSIKQANDYTESVKNFLEGKVNANKDSIDANKADADAKNTALTTRVNVLEEAKPVVENKLTEIEAKDSAQDNRLTALESRTDNFINNVAVSKEAGKVKLTYSRVDGSSSEVEFEDSDTITLAYDDEPLKKRIQALESKEDKDTIYNDTEVKQGIQANTTSITTLEGDVNTYKTSTNARLEALEHKEDKDTIYDDSAVRGQITALESKVDGNKATQDGKNTELENRIQALETKPDKDTVYDDTALAGRVTTLENKVDNDNQNLTLDDHTLSISGGNSVTLPKYDDSALKASVEELKNKDTELANKDQELTNEINTLKARTDNFVSGVAVNKEGSKVKLTYSYVDGTTKEVEFEDSDTVTLAYDDTAVKQRLNALEAKEDKDTIYNDAEVKAQIQAVDTKVDSNKQAQDATNTNLENRISALETKPDKDTVYDDTVLAGRVSALEAKEDKDTVYNDAELRGRVETLEAKTDNDKQTLSLSDHTLSISNGNSVELPKYDDSALKAKDTEQDGVLATLKEKTKSFLTGATVTRQDNVVTLTYTNIDGTSTNLEFNDNDTKAIAYDDTALKARVAELENKTDKDTVYDDTSVKERLTALENKTDKDTVYDDSAVTARLTALETKEDKDTVYNDKELRDKITALEGKTDNFVSNVGVSREGNTVKLTYTMVNGDNKEVSFTDNDTVSVAYDDSALRGRVEALENKPEVEYELVKTTKTVTPSQGEGVINLTSETTTDPLKELVLTGNVSARVKSPFGGNESTVAGKVGFNSGTTGDDIQGSHTTAVSENVYVEFYYTGSTVKAYLVYEPENDNEVVKYRKALSLAELQGTETAKISISKGDVERGYVEVTFTAVTISSNSYKVQKKG